MLIAAFVWQTDDNDPGRRPGSTHTHYYCLNDPPLGVGIIILLKLRSIGTKTEYMYV